MRVTLVLCQIAALLYCVRPSISGGKKQTGRLSSIEDTTRVSPIDRKRIEKVEIQVFASPLEILLAPVFSLWPS